MAEIGSAFLSILPSAKGFGNKLENEVSSETRGSGKRIGAGFGKAFGAAAGLLAAAGIGSFLKDSIAEAREAQKVGAATANIIKTTGQAANVTAKQFDTLTSAISAKTGIDDEVIASGGNLLLTFTNIRNEVGKGADIFNRATQAAADLSSLDGMGGITGASKQLGKALNDPLKGITALTKSGVTFTDVQKEQIKNFVEQGDILSAQKVILGEVEREFGGLAAAQSTAGEKAAVVYGNLKEQIGTALLPLVDRIARAFLRLAPAISSVIDGIGPAFTRLVALIRPFAEAVGNQLVRNFNALKAVFDFLQPTFDKIGGFFRENPAVVKAFAVTLVGLVGAIGAVTLATTLFSIALNSTGIPLIVIGIAALTAGLVYAYQTSEGFRTAVNNVATTMQTVVLPALQSMWAYFQTNVVPVLQQVAAVVRDQVLPIIASFANFVTGTLIPAVIRIATAIGSNLAPIFKQLVATFQADVLPVLQQLLVKFREYQPTIQKVILVVAQVIGKVIEFAAAVLGKVLPPVIRFAGFLISTLVPAIGSVIQIAVRIIAKVAEIGQAFLDAIKDVGKFVSSLADKITDAIGYVKVLPARAINALSSAATALVDSGRNLIQGFINGIIERGKGVVDAVTAPLRAGIAAARGVLEIFSPSRVFKKMGVFVMQGFEEGIIDRAPKVVAAIIEGMKKVVDAAKTKRDELRSVLDGFKNDFASLSSSISSTFTGNLFEATNSQDFLLNLSAKSKELGTLKKAFAKLRGFGLSPAFLSQLFASGNQALILDLASGTKSSALGTANLFGATQDLGTSLGNQVARADVGPKIDKTNAQLERLNNRIERLAKELGREINAAATAGKKGRVAA